MTDYTKLRERAIAAGCDRWEFNGEEVVAPDHELAIPELPVLVCAPSNREHSEFIAAACPATVLALLNEMESRAADVDTHRQIVADQLAEIDRLRGLAKWASGQLFDAGRTEDADRVLQLLDDAQASAPATAEQPDTDGAWPMPLACAFTDACPDGCRGVCQTTIGGDSDGGETD